MEQGMIDILTIMFSYSVWLGLLYFLLNALTLGFLNQYMKVRISLGKKILVVVKGLTHYTFRTGIISEGNLLYNDSLKNERRVTVSGVVIPRWMGINFIVVDDETNNVLDANFNTVAGFDAIRTNNLYKRALQAPRLDNNNKILIILLVIIIIGLFALAFMLFKQGQVLAVLQQGATIAGNTIPPTPSGL